MTNQLPNGWINAKLGNFTEYGKAEKAEPDTISDDTWVLELEDIEKDTSKLIQRLTYADRKSKSTKNKFKKGDVLYGKLRPYLNKVLVANDDGVCTTEIVPIQGNEFLYNRFLFYWLKHPVFLDYVTKAGYGLNMPRLGTKDGLAAPIVIPPLSEQKEIATRLDNLLAQVDTLKTRLDAIPAILKRFRQSVLAAAVSGKLTEEWRENLVIASDTWKKIKISDVVSSIDAGKNLKCIERPPLDYEYGIIKISAVTWGVYNEKESKTLPNNENFIESKRINQGDFLISRANTIDLLGNPVIVHATTKNLMLSDKVWRLEANELDKKWLSIFLKSPTGRKQIEEGSTGNQMSMRNIGQKIFLDIDMNLPEPQERKEIVRRVEQLFAFADQIEQRVQSAQKRVNHLTQAILAKAFRGELTADWREQNPDLISGENSAEALLARIKTERKQ